MALTINTNIASLNAQRNLSKSQDALTRSMQRLSSGLRINSAKDDAAGLAITNRMTAQIRGLNQASRNANDGISLAQTAEGALGETGNMLQRMRELAVQSANSTNSSADRTSLNSEFISLVAEINRIATETSFNNRNLLDGSFSGNFHVGPNADQTISVNVASAKGNTLGGTLYTQTLTLTSGLNGAGVEAANSFTGLAASELYIAGTGLSATSASKDTLSAADNAESAMALAAAINDQAGSTGVSAAVTEAAFTAAGGDYSTPFTLDSTNFLYINGQQVTGTGISDLDSLVSIINAQVTGVTASNEGGELKLVASDGRNICVAAYTNAASAIFGQSAAIGAAATPVTIARGGITLTGTADFAVNDTAIDSEITGEADTATATNRYVDDISITSIANSNEAIRVIDLALTDVDSLRGDLGAVQNRFESTIANLNSVAENLTAARSRVLDADIAMETTIMTKANILQQAGIAILAQANQTPQLALSLLS